MPTRSRSFGDEISAWQICLEAHKNNQADFAFLKDEVKRFEELAIKAEKENARQEKLKADLATQTKLVDDLRQNGRAAYAALIRYAKAKYGPNTPKIREFLPKTEGVNRPQPKPKT